MCCICSMLIHIDTMNQGWFDATTLFGLGTDVPTAIQQGMIALTHHFGNSGGTLIRMTDAMRAFRRDVTRWGLGTERTNRDAIDSAVGTALINGIDVVLNRFGDNANNRAQIIDVFRALEREWETEGAELPATNDYDKDDDHSSWGSLSMGNLGAVFGRTN